LQESWRFDIAVPRLLLPGFQPGETKEGNYGTEQHHMMESLNEDLAREYHAIDLADALGIDMPEPRKL
jgi:hypothetical protein